MISENSSHNNNLIKNYLRATLLSLEGEKAVIVLEDGQKMKWPKAKLPANLKVSESFYIIASQEINTEKQKQEIARTILEEILNGE